MTTAMPAKQIVPHSALPAFIQPHIATMIQMAIASKDGSYSVYSKFRVGASLLAYPTREFFLEATAAGAQPIPALPLDGSCPSEAAGQTGPQIIPGANVENASYGLTVCAERTAAVRAITGGRRYFAACVVAADDEESDVWPCGACRQFLAEFGLDTLIITIRPNGDISNVLTINELLPNAFTPANLFK
ncbi:hypothetical protein H696_03366 [Fonticula alba]|uniref:CMP/dCMP-type deaminase domain-containing protein n=1 Tax=Fonticula alba TaxID=691883 RepID=A0A058Z6J2_FONAL|nr:hypothetical protein H696_03366 [Fonticula alba]KCV69899.1 hypothetical protein H696_03366 [Fonticula alba]|eukprot:XP_009495505.1 hypothetical protein H696_03366 [Fonticula alba]